MPEQHPYAAPPQEPRRTLPAPEGFRYEWAVAHAVWQVYQGETRGCRFTIGPGQRQCKRPAVAVLDRACLGQRASFWAYCEDHLYGRVLHDGAIWDVVLRPIAKGRSSVGFPRGPQMPVRF